MTAPSPPPPGRETSLAIAVSDYRRGVFAYREMVTHLLPLLKDFGDKKRDSNQQEVERLIRQSMEDGSKAQRRKTAAALRKFATAIDDAAKAGRKDKVIKVGKTVAPVFIGLTKLAQKQVDPEIHVELLNRGILTGLVTNIEVFMSRLVREFLTSCPGALEGSDSQITIATLRRCSTVQEALDIAIEDRVQTLLYGGLKEWQKFFQSRLKIEMSDCAIDWEQIREIVMRRHIVVHTGGRVSRRYLAEISALLVSKYVGENVQAGQQLTLPNAYVATSLDHLEIFGVHLGLAVWLKMRGTDAGQIGQILSDVIYELCVRQDWVGASHLALWGSSEDAFSENTKRVCKINHWQALKWQGRWEEIKKDVENFNCSGLEPRFAACRSALLEDMDGFLKLAKVTKGAGLDRLAWDEWPIFRGLRADSRFATCRDKCLGVRKRKNATDSKESAATLSSNPESSGSSSSESTH